MLAVITSYSIHYTKLYEVLLRRLENEGVTSSDGQREHETGQHHRKIECGNARSDPQGLLQRIV